MTVNKRKKTQEESATRLLRAIALALACGSMLLAGCGGSTESSDDIPGSICVTFTADGAPASPNIFAQTAATANCDPGAVDLSITGINDVYTVSFAANYNPAVVSFAGHSLAGSILASDGDNPQVVVTQSSGRVEIGITKTTGVGTGIDIGAGETEFLVRLLFARAGSAGSSSLAFDSTQVLDSQGPPQVKSGIVWRGGTLEITLS